MKYWVDYTVDFYGGPGHHCNGPHNYSKPFNSLERAKGFAEGVNGTVRKAVKKVPVQKLTVAALASKQRNKQQRMKFSAGTSASDVSYSATAVGHPQGMPVQSDEV